MTLAERIQARLAELAEERAAIDAELNAIASDPEARGLDDDAALARIGELRARGEVVVTEITQGEQRLADVVDAESRRAAAAAAVPAPALPAFARGTHQEERTYRPDLQNERSFFQDAYLRGENREAAERLERHMREVQLERRDIGSSALNGLVPPLYLLDQAAALARAMRPLADIMPKYPLPAQGMTMYATRVVTGSATAVQTSENTAPSEVDLTTTDISFGVVSIIGVQDVSRQALERGAVTDSLVMADLVADYATKLDTQLISGTGSNGQIKGLLTISATTVSFTGTTVASFYSKFLGAASGVAGARFAPATIAIMHPRRWHWLLAAADTTGRPIVVPNPGVGFNVVGTGGTESGGIAGTLAGIPVLLDANVSITSGASSNEDRVILTRLSDHVFAEGDLMTFRFEQFITPPTTIRMAVMGYSAATFERYTSATQVLVGTGLVAPTF
jgi:HK97 family phage major capsid protein